MKWVQYINNRSEELMAEQDAHRSYSLVRDSEGDALKKALKISRWLLTGFFLFKTVASYLFVTIRLKKKPGAPITNKKVQEHKDKLKYIGMENLKRTT